jgi:hypothetical protein
MTLDDYFHTIINKPRIVYIKETTMFDKTKMFFNEQIEKINSLLTKPTAFVETEDTKLHEEGYWTFEMHTPEYLCDGEVEPEQYDVLFDLNDSTWMDTLDQILDVMGKHYGYNIKEQVYYSVTFPTNEPSPYTGEIMAGHGRMLNDGILQQLLLAFPEVYERDAAWDKTKDVFQ